MSEAPGDDLTGPVIRFSILTVVHDVGDAGMEDTIASVLRQHRADWEWVLLEEGAIRPTVRHRLRQLAQSESRVRLLGGTEDSSSNAYREALGAAAGEVIVMLAPDDVLAPSALARVAQELDADPALDYLYSDHDRIDLDGRTRERISKPDWSPERLRHHRYPGHLSVVRRSLAIALGAVHLGPDGSPDHDLLLRVTEGARRVMHVPEVLYHRHGPPASEDAPACTSDGAAGVQVVQAHLDRVGISAVASAGRAPATFQVEREPDLHTPTSIVVPTIGTSGVVGGVERVMIVETLRSVLAGSRHEALEVVVVHDRPTPVAVLEHLEAMSTAAVPVRLVEFAEPFSFSRKCNVGALHATGENLVFLNDDMQAVSAGVPEHLTAPLGEPGVGATGAKLLFEDGRIQHAGLVYGSGTVSHSYYRADGNTLGHHGELWINREVSALTGACVGIRREVLEEIGGFTEDLPINYNDVDLSLKVRRTGRRLLWLHGVVLHHYESVSRSPDVHPWESELIARRWGDVHEVKERYTLRERGVRDHRPSVEDQ